MDPSDHQGMHTSFMVLKNLSREKIVVWAIQLAANTNPTHMRTVQ
jgi:hypothetical protein